MCIMAKSFTRASSARHFNRNAPRGPGDIHQLEAANT